MKKFRIQNEFGTFSFERSALIEALELIEPIEQSLIATLQNLKPLNP